MFDGSCCLDVCHHLDSFFLPACQKNVHSTRFVTYFCEHVLPNLSTLASPVAELDIQLEVSQRLQWRC